MLKNLLFLLAFLSCFNVVSQPYLNQSARWVQKTEVTNSGYTTFCSSTFYFVGDSTINSKVYMKLNEFASCYVLPPDYDSTFNPPDTLDGTYLRALIREENKAVYILDFIDGTERILYNFGMPDYTSIELVVGNSACQIEDSVLIETHDTVCIGNIKRKRWAISTSPFPIAEYFIEGVGPSSGFLGGICGTNCQDCIATLLSFEMNGDTLYMDNCTSINAISKLDTKHSIKQLNNQIIIEGKGIAQLKMYDLSHHLIMQQHNNNVSQVAADFTLLPTGIYLYYGIASGVPFSGKFAYFSDK
jgi:hypothetical protein